MTPDYSYEDKLEGQQISKEERYAQMIDYMNDVPDFNRHNGIHLIELRDDYAVCRVELTSDALNPQGMAHGAIIFAICDVAAGYAAAYVDRRCVTQAANIYFLRPACSGYLTAKAEPIKVGRTLSVVEAKAYDDEGRLIAEATFSVFYT